MATTTFAAGASWRHEAEDAAVLLEGCGGAPALWKGRASSL